MPSKRRKQNSFQYLKRKFSMRMQKKLAMLFLMIVLAFAVLIGRITYINAASKEKYTKNILDQQRYDSRVIPYKRGDIVDRNGTKIATSERVYNVILDAELLLGNEDDIAPTLQELETCFDIKEEEVQKILDDQPDSRYSILKKGISYETAQVFEKKDEDEKKYPNLNGVWLEEDYVRTYPYNTLACDMIGFTSAGNVGNGGLEGQYNDILNGTDGREYGYLEKDSSFSRTVKEAQNGNSVVSTIDANLQGIVERHILAFNQAHQNEVREGAGSKNTAVMIMNPNNGQILAMASYPTFDLNNPRDLTTYVKPEELAVMTEDQKIEQMNFLWKNFCVSDTFEPGSTFKPFTTAMGLETGKLSGAETYVCEGYLHYGDNDIACHYTAGHGLETIEQAIANSCNVALMHMAETIGSEEFCKYQRAFGFGQYTGINLPGEAATEGLLFTTENMKPVDLATSSFGQSFNVTMTQLAAGFCSLVNGGEYYEPQTVKSIQDEGGNIIESIEPVLLRRTISEKTSATLKQHMKAVMDYGTGQSAQVPGYDIGGKTGTAEKFPRNQGNYVLSFIGYAPQEKPEAVIYVVIDEPNVAAQDSSSYVTTLSAEIMAEAFPYMNITKMP